MNAKFLKATTFVVAGLFASVAVAQDDAAAPEVPAGPTPQEVAAQNMNELLELVKQGRSRAAGENRAREQRFAQDKANQGRDPYGLFKAAITSGPDADVKSASRASHADWKARASGRSCAGSLLLAR